MPRDTQTPPALPAWGRLAVAALLLLFALQAASSARVKNVTVDEITYIAAGYHHVRSGEFSFNRTNPPLLKLLPGFALRSLDLELPPGAEAAIAGGEVGAWRYAHRFLYENREDPDRILWRARLPVLGLGVVLGLYVFAFARRAYGLRAGLVALALYSSSPNLLAHTRLATLDLGLALFCFAAAFHLWRFAEAPAWRRALASGVALGAAIATKTTAFFLAPAALALLPLLLRQREALLRLPGMGTFGQLRPPLAAASALAGVGLAIGAAALLVVNGIYGFEGSGAPLLDAEEMTRVEARLGGGPGARLAAGLAGALPLPIPEGFADTLKFQARRAERGNNVYFAGRVSREGWWYVMPFALLVKTPIPLQLLLGAAAISLLRSRRLHPGEALALAAALLTVGLFSYLKSVSIGIRYVLPALPFLHVLASRTLRDGVVLRPAANAALLGLAIWLGVGTARIYPHYLAYFNEWVGGPAQGHRYLADSFLDWGQDLKLLGRHLEREGIGEVRLAYFGSGSAKYQGIRYRALPSVGLEPSDPDGTWWYERGDAPLPEIPRHGPPIAISATLLAGVFYPGYYAWLRDEEPVAQVGHSILIYDFGPGAESGEQR